MKNVFKYIMCAGLAMTASTVVTSCNDYMDGDTWTASAELQMDEYMETQPDLSLFLALVDQAELRGLIHAYGTYTLFVPNNTGMKNYLGATSDAEAQSKISALSAADAREVVKYHILSDTLHTYNMQANTRLAQANMAQDYLVTNWNEASDIYTLNRNNHITNPDVHNGNGIIHVIDGVLFRPPYSVMDAVIDTLQAHEYGIMAKLLTDVKDQKLTPASRQLVDSLINSLPYKTFVAQPDELMQKDGLLTVDDLCAFLQKNNIKDYDEETLLVNWIGYHFIRGRYYLSDIVSSGSITTLSPLGKAITVSASSYSDIHLNRFEAFDDPGIDLITDGYFVDYPCNDGVIQSTSGELQIIERAATRINWDMADVPEIRANAGFRKAGTNIYFNTTSSSAGFNASHPEWITDSTIVRADGSKVYWFDTELSSTYSWYGSLNPVINYHVNYEAKEYGVPEPYGSKYEEYVYGDYLNFRLGTTVLKQLDIKTPTLVEGVYKVWLRLRRAGNSDGSNGLMRMTFIQDGEEDQTFASVSLSSYSPKSSGPEDDEKNAAKGEQIPSASYPGQNYIACHLLGTINVKHDGVHVLRWTPLDANQALGQYFDMIYFIPVDNDQVLPRVMANGEDARIYKVCWDEETQSAYYDKSVYYDVSGFNADMRTHIWPNRCPVVDAMERGTITEDKIGTCTRTWCPNHSAEE